MTKQPTPKYLYDVFLSHHSADKPMVERLASQLEDREGLKPFLDKWHLVPGEPWQEALEEALNSSASCAVFLGQGGVGSWENEEMRAALDERVCNKSFRVIPVLLPGANPKDPSALPRFLRRLTWVDFRSGLDDPEAFSRFVAGIRGKAPGRGVMSPLPDTRLRGNYSLLLLFLPTFIVVMAVLGLMNWYFPTRIQVELSVYQAVFSIGGMDSKPILNSVQFRSLTVEEFAYIELIPDKLEVANPAQYQLAEDQYPESAWSPLKVNSKIKITGQNETLQPSVTLESADKRVDTAGTLDQIRARPGSEVSLEVRGSGATSVTVKIDRQESYAAFSTHHPFRLTTRYCLLSGSAGLPFQTNSLTYRARLSDRSPEVEVRSRPSSVVYNLVISPEKNNDLISQGGIPVTALGFTAQDEAGNPVTTLVREGEITYPDYPGIDKVSFKPPDFLGLDQLKKFNIKTMALEPEHQAIRLRLDGIAGHVRTGSSEFPRDHRLTRFDSLWQNPHLMALLSIIIWVVPTAVGGYKLYRGTKGGRI